MKKLFSILLILILLIWISIATGCKPKEIVDEEPPTILNLDPYYGSTINGQQSIEILFSETIKDNTLEVDGTIIPPSRTPQLVWEEVNQPNDKVTILPPPESDWVDSGNGFVTLIIDGCIDPSENELEGIPLTFQYKVDTVPPVASLTGVPGSMTNETSINIIVGGEETTAYKYLLDDEDNSWDWSTADEFNIDQTLSESNLTNGNHELRVIGKDEAGNWQSQDEATIRNWYIDAIPPQAQLSNTPPGVTNQTSINIEVSGVDVVAYKYLLDDKINGWDWSGAFEITNMTLPITRSNLSEGNHELRVIGRDELGNWQDSKEATTILWEIDTSESIIELINTPPYSTHDPNYTFEVGGDDIVAYKYSFDLLPDWSSISEIDIASQNQITGTLSGVDGSNTIRIIGKNIYGTWQSTPTTYTWILDTQPPQDTTITGRPDGLTPEGVTTNNSDLNWSWEDVHTADSGTAVYYQIKLEKTDTGDIIMDWADTTLLTYTKEEVLLDGEYTFSVSSIDLAGNKSATDASDTIMIDTTPPSATATGISEYTDSSITITFDEDMNTTTYDISGTLVEGLIQGTDYTPSWSDSQNLTLTLEAGKAWNTGSDLTLDLSGVTDLVGHSCVSVLSYDVAITPPGGGSPKVLYVAKDGTADNPVSNSNMGSQDYPKATISNAIETLYNAGYDTSNPAEVRVAAGQYTITEPVIIRAGITLKGGYKVDGIVDWSDSERSYQTEAERADAMYLTEITYDGTDTGDSTNNPNYAVYISGNQITDETIIEGFTINGTLSGGSNTAFYTSAVYTKTNTEAIIQYNTIYGGDGMESSCGIYNSISKVNIRYNVIRAGGGIVDSWGIYNYASPVIIEENDLIYGGTSGSPVGITNFSCDVTNAPIIRNNPLIIGGGSDGSYVTGIDNNMSHAIIDNNYVRGSDYSGSGQVQALYNKSCSPIITNNTLEGGTGSIYLALFNTTNSSPFVANNVLSGVYVNYNMQSSMPYLYNNTFVCTGWMAIVMVTNSQPTIVNNIFTGSTIAAIYEWDTTADPVEIKNNCFSNSGNLYRDENSNNYSNVNDVNNMSDTDSSGNIQESSPNFADSGNDDYHLTASTPASITEGGLDLTGLSDFPTNTSGEPTDKDKTINRNANGFWSIGAYEWD